MFGELLFYGLLGASFLYLAFLLRFIMFERGSKSEESAFSNMDAMAADLKARMKFLAAGGTAAAKRMGSSPMSGSPGTSPTARVPTS